MLAAIERHTITVNDGVRGVQVDAVLGGERVHDEHTTGQMTTLASGRGAAA